VIGAPSFFQSFSADGKAVAVPCLLMGCILQHHFANATLSVSIDMMNTAQLKSITSAAMTLPERERAKFTHNLVAILDGKDNTS
jgi:hypothetical protein